jgi:hypothetical protein
MVAFAKQYAFEFRCHAIQYCNRKAGEERSFWTVGTNFLPGRTFAHRAPNQRVNLAARRRVTTQALQPDSKHDRRAFAEGGAQLIFAAHLPQAAPHIAQTVRPKRRA